MITKTAISFLMILLAFIMPIKGDLKLPMDRFTNTEKHYSIEFPTTWETKTHFKELDFVTIAPAETPDDPFRENMSVISGKLDATLSLDQFYQGNVANLKTALKEFKMVKEGDISFKDLPVKWILYTHQLNKQDVQVVQYFIIHDNFAYVITGSAEVAKFPRYQEAFETIAKTFIPQNPS